MSNVIILDRKRGASESMLSFFNSVKDRVESGDCNSLFIVGTCANGDVITGYSVDEDGRVYSLLGGVEALKKQFIEKQIE